MPSHPHAPPSLTGARAHAHTGHGDLSRRELLQSTLGLTALSAAEVAAAASSAPVRLLDASQTLADLQLLHEAVREAHPGWGRYQTVAESEAAFESLRSQSLKAPITDLALYGLISAWLAGLRCDHTKAELPAALGDWREDHASHLPFRFRLLEGRMWVLSGPANLPRGSEVLAIEGRSIVEWRKLLSPLVSIDGRTDAVRDWKLSHDADLMGSDWDQFMPLWLGLRSRFALSVRRPGEARVQTLSVSAISHRQWQSLGWPGAAAGLEFQNALHLRLAERQQAVLRVGSFVNYRNPVDARSLFAAFFKTLNSSRVEHLVLDLRDNAGGSDDAAQALAAHLLDRPFVWQSESLFRAVRYGAWTRHVETWGDPKEVFEPPLAQFRQRSDGWWQRLPDAETEELNPIAPAPDRFAGRVSLLCGPANASGATMLIAKLRDAGRVRLVGEASGGSAEGPTAGRLLFLTLPASRITVHLPLRWNRTGVAQFKPGLGIQPDLPVPTRIEDLLAGRDAALQAAVEAPV